jgi:hypothetical protein
MNFTKDLMHCVQISWFYLLFIIYLCLWPKVKPKQKTTCLDWGKKKTTTQPPLLSTNVTLSQQNRWCWIFVRSSYTLQNKTNIILTQIQWWIWEKQLIKPKVQRLPHGNHSMKPTSTPSTSNTCNFLTTKPMMLNFCEELVHFAN